MRLSLVLCVLGLLASSAVGGDSRIDRSLAWLAGQQNKDGSWCVQGKGGADRDVATTGFALLAFVGSGDTHRTGPHAEQVKNGMRWLKSAQTPEGHFFGGDRPDALRVNAIASLAYIENFALTRSPVFKKSSQLAVDYLAGAFVKLEEKDLPDAQTTSWILMVLKSAELAELKISEVARRRCLAHLDSMTDEDTGKIKAETTAQVDVATAAATFGRIMGGLDPKTDQLVGKGLDHLGKNLPKWMKGGVDPRYVLLGTLAAFQRGGETWKAWRRALKSEIAGHQVEKGDDAGTWELGTEGAVAIGPVASVAALTMTLQVYYRYTRVYR